MTNKQIFEYLETAVRSIAHGREHFAVQAADRERHHHEMLEVLYALEAVKTLVPRESFPQWCFLCGDDIAIQEDVQFHGLGECVEMCTRCGGSGEEPKEAT